MDDIDINELCQKEGLMWRLTATRLPGEYSAVLHFRGPADKKENLILRITTDLVEIASLVPHKKGKE